MAYPKKGDVWEHGEEKVEWLVDVKPFELIGVHTVKFTNSIKPGEQLPEWFVHRMQVERNREVFPFREI